MQIHLRPFTDSSTFVTDSPDVFAFKGKCVSLFTKIIIQLTDIRDVVPLHDDVGAEVTCNNNRHRLQSAASYNRATRNIYTCAAIHIAAAYRSKYTENIEQNDRAFIRSSTRSIFRYLHR